MKSTMHQLLGLLAFVVVLGLGLTLGGCHRGETPKKDASNASATPAAPASVAQASGINFDLVDMPLSQVAQIITSITGYGFSFDKNESILINWSQSGVKKDEVFPIFEKILAAQKMKLSPMNQTKTFWLIQSTEREQLIPYALDFGASRAKGVFILWNDQLYKVDEFPYKIEHSGGRLYAMLPKAIAAEQQAKRDRSLAPAGAGAGPALASNQTKS